MRRLWTITGLLLVADVAGAACPTNSAYPGDEWRSLAEVVARQRPIQIAELDDYAFTLVGEDGDRTGIRTDGLVVVKNGELVYERYGRGFERHTRHLVWSVTKSFVDALTGAAVRRGMLALDDSICDHLAGIDRPVCLADGEPLDPEICQPDPIPAGNVCGIMALDLLEQGSGLTWNEGYENDPYAVSSVLAMLFGEGRTDMAAFVTGQGLATAPGDSFVYSTGGVTLLAAVIGGAVGGRLAGDFPWLFLFDPIGMKRVVLERDNRGVFVGGSFLWATPRDLARFGHLYLNDGCWAGERLVPEGWVAASTRVNESFLNGRPFWQGPEIPGRLWWLNAEVEGINDAPPWPDVPSDAFAAIGHWGQAIVVIPSLDLVVVRVGDDRDDTFDLNELLRLVIAVVEGG